MNKYLAYCLGPVTAGALASWLLGSCSAGEGNGVFGAGGSSGADASLQLDEGLMDACTPGCSPDHKAVVGCQGTPIQTCGAHELCAGSMCKPACEAVKDNRSSVGCDYYPVVLNGFGGARRGCFAVFVANTWGTAAHVQIERGGASLDPEAFGRIPSGTGSALQYGAFHASEGIAPGEVAIFFLQGGSGEVACPAGVTPASVDAQVQGNGIGEAFHLQADVPVVAYQMLPYGGGSAAVTGASLLLPTSAWDTNYVAVNAYKASEVAQTNPTLNLIASEDDTEIKLLPKVALAGGGGVPSGPANNQVTLKLAKGQHVQVVQKEELTGSPIESNKPIGMIAGHECMNVPPNAPYCDHAEQQIPPVRALGYKYACVSYRQRSSVPESPPWRVIGAVADTQLQFDPPSVHPSATLNLGDVLELTSSQPFTVKSQDQDHPFVVTTYMTGSSTVDNGYGDADFVRIVPPGQYLNRYVFFTDPTYPETNLVVVRTKDTTGQFRDVELDCAGALGGWEPLGSAGDYEYTRADLIRHDFAAQGSCSNGRHEMKSEAPFGLWVWGWGTSETALFTENVSYGYPAGENVVQINTVYIPPVPK